MPKENQAYFYVVDGSLRCRLSSEGKIVNLNRKNAKELLKEIDKNKFELKIKHGKIQLTNDYDSIQIDISKEIFTGEYKYLVRKTYKKLRRLQREYMREKYKGSEIKKNLVRGALIGAGPLAGILIAVSLNHQPDTTNELKAEPIVMEQYQDETENYLAERIQEIPNEEYLDNFTETINEGEIELTPIEETNLVDYGLETYYSEVDLPIEDLSQENDVIALREQYWDVAKRAEDRWGIDARVLLAMLTQESRGKETNLMQIEFDAIDDSIMTVYNFQEERYMRVVFTNNPDKYAGKVDMTLNKAELTNPITQLGAAAIIMNYNNLNDFNAILNPCAMIDEYNKGLPLFLEVLDAAPDSRMDILNNPTDLSFLAYDYVCGAGDPEYVNNTMRYVDLSEGPLIMKTFNKDENGNKYPVVVQFNINKTLSNKISL